MGRRNPEPWLGQRWLVGRGKAEWWLLARAQPGPWPVEVVEPGKPESWLTMRS